MRKVKFKPLVDPKRPHLGIPLDGYATEYEGIEIVVAKNKLDNKKIVWRAYEASTHMWLGVEAWTRKDALQLAIEKIRKKGVEETKKIVEEVRKKHAHIYESEK